MNRFTSSVIVAVVAVALGAGTNWSLHTEYEVPLQAYVAQAVPTIEIQSFSSNGESVRDIEPEIAVCDIGEEVLKPDTALDELLLQVGTKEYSYTERRWNSPVKFQDPEKQIALRVLNTATCERETVVITKRGDALIAPAGWDIEAVKRLSGIRWNNWATQYKVHTPSERVVLFNLYPRVQGGGASRTISYVRYVPYNQDIHVPLLIDTGQSYMVDLASRALSELRRLKVPSRAVPGTLLADTPVAQVAWLARLGPTEHMDHGEFIFDQQWSFQHALIRIGANGTVFGALTCSKASACGLMQFTDNGKWENGFFKPGTYERLRKANPTAKLIPTFTEGARDPLNAMKAAFLHHDDVYAGIIKKFGARTPTNPLVLEELVGAGYNAGTARAISAYEDMLNRKTTDWTRLLPKETIGYIEKIRFIRTVWSQPSVTTTVHASDF